MADGLGNDDRAARVAELYRRYREALQRVRETAGDPETQQAASDEVLALGAEIDALADGTTIDLDADAPPITRP